MKYPIHSAADLRICLREKRRILGIGQDEIPGVGRTTVVAFENGHGDPKLETAFAIINALGCKLEIDLDLPSLSDIVDLNEEIDLEGPSP